MYCQLAPKLFCRFLEHAPVAVAMLDWEMRYLLTSGKWLTIHGLGEKNLLGRSHWEIFPHKAYPGKETIQRCLAGAVELGCDKGFVCPDGSVKSIKWEIHPWREATGEIGGLVILTTALDTAIEMSAEIGIAQHSEMEAARQQSDIAKRKQTEQALRASEARFQKLAANMPGAIYQFLLRPDGTKKIVYISPGCRDLYELEPEAVEQNIDLLWSLTHPDDLQSLQETIAASAATLTPWHNEARIVTPSGKLKWIQGASRPERLEGGDILWDGLLLDITSRKQAEEQLLGYREHLEELVAERTAQLIQTNKQLSQEIASRQQAEAALRESEARFRAAAEGSLNGFFIFQCLRDETGRIEDFTFAYLNSNAEKMISMSQQEVIGKRVCQLLPFIRTDGFFEKYVRVMETRTVLEEEIPISTPEMAASWLQHQVVPLPDGVAVAVRDISERKSAIEGMRQSEQLLRLALKAARMRVWNLDIKTNNLTIFEDLGSRLSSESGSIKNLEDFLSTIHPEDRERVYTSIQSALAREADFEVDFRRIAPDGSKRWICGKGDVLREAGRVVGLAGVSIDITDRKQTEESLRRTNSVLKAQQEAAIDGILVVDENRQVVSYNTRFRQLWQIPEELMHSGDERRMLSYVLSNRKQPQEFFARVEYLYEHPDEASRHEIHLNDGRVFDCYSGLVLSPEGDCYGRIWYFRDISDRKQVEEALRQSEARFTRLAANVPGMIYQYVLRPDSSDYFSYVSPGCRELYERDPEEILGDAACAFGTAHPDDQQQLECSILISAQTLQPWNWEGRVIAPSGRLKWVQGISRPEKQANGDIVWDGLLIDITDRKQAEEALQRSEARFRELAQQEALLNRIANLLRHSLDIDIIIETTVHEIRNLFQIDRTNFLWYRPNANPSGWEVVKEAKRENLPSALGICSEVDIGVSGELLIGGETLRVDEVVTISDPVIRQRLLDLGYTSILNVPFHTQFGEIGVLSLAHCSCSRPWTDSEVELLQAVTVQLAIAIDQAELYKQSRTAAAIAQEQATKLEQALHELQRTQTQLIQTEKMSSLGQMVAGLAHEINNPVTFIYGNVNHARYYFQDLLSLIHLYQQEYPRPSPSIQQFASEIELEFLVEDLQKLLTSIKVGAERIRDIVLSLRHFSRLDQAATKSADIHSGLEQTLRILEHRLRVDGSRSEIEVIKEYGQLPKVTCYPGQLNQVFMNILSNAIDALEQARSQGEDSHKKPLIRIRTQVTNSNSVQICIADNGCGMSEDVLPRIFDPFFTTKPVGSGRGLGLSVSYSIVVDSHKGQLSCVSQLGQGTELAIELPI